MFILILLIPAVIALVGLAVAEDRTEDYLYIKLFGHAILGIFTFNINQLPLPVGYVIALIMAANATTNKKARRVASTVSFIIWLLGLLFF
jgi:hypothetical protein